MQIFHQEAQSLSQKMGFEYDREVAEKMIQYAESKLPNY
ncbi:aminoglycoside adenylyltransferase [Streptococcus infantis SK1302]|uniref:Aminoglycoside adenylyltransferase n=2 Tax=Streptococcus infantis TaxID=68892 RepID=A0ABN0B3E8_9STRE|nr:aminoglycoside adenylyltransferase [Streptococcus infantis SK1302]